MLELAKQSALDQTQNFHNFQFKFICFRALLIFRAFCFHIRERSSESTSTMIRTDAVDLDTIRVRSSENICEDGWKIFWVYLKRSATAASACRVHVKQWIFVETHKTAAAHADRAYPHSEKLKDDDYVPDQLFELFSLLALACWGLWHCRVLISATMTRNSFLRKASWCFSMLEIIVVVCFMVTMFCTMRLFETFRRISTITTSSSIKLWDVYYIAKFRLHTMAASIVFLSDFHSFICWMQ